MGIPEVTVLYAGLLGLLSIVLGAAPGAYRGKNAIDVGDGGDPELVIRMRRQANFLETVPLALILIGFLEMRGVTNMAIHGLGAALLLGRVLHAATFRQGVKSIPRGIGSGLSVLSIAIASIWCIVTFVT